MSHGKGSIPKRKVERILKDNGYEYVRFNGHYIYRNKEGKTIAIPQTYCTYIIQREFKEKGVVMS